MDNTVWMALAFAGCPAMIGLLNLLCIRSAQGRVPDRARVSILIAARDAEAEIEACIAHAVGQIGIAVEVLVMDQGSRDRTAARVAAIAARESRVRLLTCPPPPPGWTATAHARARLAEAALGTHLLFIEAGVRLEPHAAAALAGQAARLRAGMVTGVPRQRMLSAGEAVMGPMNNLLRMVWLPGGGRALTQLPALAAACGQMMLFSRTAYDRVGGHDAVRAAPRDGLALARRMRAARLRTDMVDAAGLASCRPHRGLAESWAALSRSGRDRMVAPVGVPLRATALGLAHLLPLALLPPGPAVLALLLMVALRIGIAARAREAWWTVPLHPLAMCVAMAAEWAALMRLARQRGSTWKDRAHPAPGLAAP